MKLTTDIEDEIDAIRDRIYEKIKDMTVSEEIAYFNAIAVKAKEEHGFCVIKSVRDMQAETVTRI